MKPISYTVPHIVQGESECVQTSAAQLLAYYGVQKTIEEIKNEVPFVYSKNGKPLGTSFAYIALYFSELGFKTAMHVSDLEIFDRTWASLTRTDLIKKLRKRSPHLAHAFYEREVLDVIFDGYIRFLKAGGIIQLPVVTHAYLYSLLQQGPIYASVDYQFLNDAPKYTYSEKKNQWIPDDIKGVALTHALIISGYKNGTYTIVDPDYRYGGIRTIEADRLLGALYLAQLNFDNILITLKPNRARK